MTYETKVILIALADAACDTNSREMYRKIAKMANAEGLVLKPYEEAKAEIEAENAKATSSKYD